MSIRIFVLTATAASLLMLGGCDVVKSSSTPATPKRPSVAATVNGTNIAESQLETIFKQNGAEAMINDEALRARVIDQLAVQLIAAKEAAKAPAVQPAAPVQQAAAAPAPQVEEGIPGDVIAAIMAAIHAMGNGKYTLKAVRRSKNGWGNAGVNDTTAPF